MAFRRQNSVSRSDQALPAREDSAVSSIQGLRGSAGDTTLPLGIRPPIEPRGALPIRLTPEGFALNERGTLREFRDADVIGLRTTRERNEDDEAGAKLRRRLEIRVDDAGAERIITINASFFADEPDLLEPVFERLLSRLVERSQDALVREGSVAGPSWTLSDIALDIHLEGRRRTIALDQIAAADWQEDDFCIWRAGDESPAARFPDSEENTHVLAALLARIAARRETETDEAEGLGRSLAEFKTLNVPMSIAILLVIGGAYVAAVYPLHIPFGWKFAGGLLPMLLTAGVCGVVPGGMDRLRHHTRGIVLVRGRKEFALPFEELRSFSVRWIDHHYNGMYTNSSAEFLFYTMGRGECPSPLKFTLTCRRNASSEAQARAMQDGAAEAVASRLREKLAQTGRVPWTTAVTILPDGLEVQSRPSDGAVRVPFSVECRFHDGKMTLRADDLSRPCTSSTDGENFFAGLKLVEWLAAGKR